MEKSSEITLYIVVGVLALYLLVYALTRGVGRFVAIVLQTRDLSFCARLGEPRQGRAESLWIDAVHFFT